ncbi:MAG TPA: AraC family transcriptional regulator ligand-binding domain-containing protein [Polyangiaceae bacterium]|nr:AraC family transcriptional regulator ligand-binding domain-containing protein [Polyangiaceae bacterium]
MPRLLLRLAPGGLRLALKRRAGTLPDAEFSDLRLAMPHGAGFSPSSGVAVDSDPARFLPAAKALAIVRLVQRWNVRPEQLLGPLGLSEERLEEPLARLAHHEMRALVERARELTAEPGLGFYMGVEQRISSYGYLGFAAMSAATVREALELTVQFVPALTNAFDVRMRPEGKRTALVIDLHVDFGSVADVMLLSMFVGLWQLGSALTGTELTGHTDLTIAEPHYYRRFAHLLPEARFGQPVNRVLCEEWMLDLPLLNSDRAALRLAREQCQAMLDAMVSESGLVQRVRGLVTRSSNRPASIADVAAAEGVSPRTLKRKLAAQGVSFSALLADTRRETALHLLTTSSLSVDAIAKRLGYSTSPNFIRAFRRWTGETPVTYRQYPQGPPPEE